MNMHLSPTFRKHFVSMLGLIITGMISSNLALAQTLNLYVQPIASIAETERAFKPLADYLSKKTGHQVRVKTEMNFLAYWERMRRSDDYHLVLDAAHFTDYRAAQKGYKVLAKVPDTVSFSLVTSEDVLLFEAEELVGKSIAAAPSPSLGGVRMAEIFPNPLRQPNLVQSDNFQAALDKIRKGKVKAALVPTPLINGDSTVNTVMTTEPVPHMAISASPKVDAKTRDAVRKALVNAAKDKQGQAMLQKLNFASFEPASNATYAGQAELLQGVWGYESGAFAQKKP